MTTAGRSKLNWRIGVDVGGTFTDLIAVDTIGQISVHKVPTTATDPAQGVLAAVIAAAADVGLQPSEFLARVTLFAHGSTIATNTVLEGKGAKVGLITTAGFRDALEIRRGYRENPWDHRTPYAPVLVPRHLRLAVGGRLDRNGNESAPLAVEDVAKAAGTFRQERVESIAVCLFNSYIDPRHESEVVKLIGDALPELPVTPSERVAPIIGEYERSSTAVLNAYIAPRTVSYLVSLDARLAELGLTVPLLLIQNNGGAVAVAEIAERPVALLLSGPAAGVGALKHYASAIGTDDLVSMEIGGTSCDVILMKGGSVSFSDRLDIGGYVCIAPAVEIHTVGAGGGTIARVDNAGLLQIGPTGAGAFPGPACYGNGGDEATITDAQVALGRIKPGPMAGGTIVIDPLKACDVIDRKIAGPLGISVDQAAAGMVRLMDQKLLHAVQRLSSERGHDPAQFTLVAAGGAGPLHGPSVGRLLGSRRVYLPQLAGAFCALGMLHSDVRHDYMKVYFDDLSFADFAAANAIFAELEQEARAVLARERFSPEDTTIVRAMDLRYTGQQWDITIGVPDLNSERLRADFEADHQRLFGHTQPNGPIEITRLRLAGIGKLPPLAQSRRENGGGSAEVRAMRAVWIDPMNGWLDTPVYDPRTLAPGQLISGPAIIEETTSTVLIGCGDTLHVDATGGYLVTFDRASA